jgi:hypothetical protein
MLFLVLGAYPANQVQAINWLYRLFGAGEDAAVLVKQAKRTRGRANTFGRQNTRQAPLISMSLGNTRVSGVSDMVSALEDLQASEDVVKAIAMAKAKDEKARQMVKYAAKYAVKEGMERHNDR